MDKSGRDVGTHRIYKNKKGKKVIGTTTALKILDKPKLIPWAWKLGTQGIDWRNFKDDKAEIGKLLHRMLFCYDEGIEVNTDYYTKSQINLAKICFQKYTDWEKEHKIKIILLETPSISEKYQYGGTFDKYCLLDGVLTQIDYKTGKAIYKEFYYQLAAYKQLIEENYGKVEQNLILRLGRNELEGFEVRLISNKRLKIGFRIFKNCLKICKDMKMFDI